MRRLTLAIVALFTLAAPALAQNPESRDDDPNTLRVWRDVSAYEEAERLYKGNAAHKAWLDRLTACVVDPDASAVYILQSIETPRLYMIQVADGPSSGCVGVVPRALVSRGTSERRTGGTRR